MKKVIKMVLTVCIILGISAIHGYGVWNEPIYNTEIESDHKEHLDELNQNSSVEQKFRCTLNNMQSVRIQPTTFGRGKENGTLTYELKEVMSGEIITNGTINCEEFKDGEYYDISFPVVKDSKNKDYVLKLQDNNTPKKLGASFYITEKGKDTQLLVNGEEKQISMFMQVQSHIFNVEEFVMMAALLAYIILFVKLLYKFLR